MRSASVPVPGALSELFSRAGFTATLNVSRVDGEALDEDDLARAEALLALWEARDEAQRAHEAALRLRGDDPR